MRSRVLAELADCISIAPPRNDEDPNTHTSARDRTEYKYDAIGPASEVQHKVVSSCSLPSAYDPERKPIELSVRDRATALKRDVVWNVVRALHVRTRSVAWVSALSQSRCQSHRGHTYNGENE